MFRRSLYKSSKSAIGSYKILEISPGLLLFRPQGLLGILYWYAVVPLHQIVFGGMLNGIKRAAESS